MWCPLLHARGAPPHFKRRWYPAPTCKTASGVSGDGMVSTRGCGAQPNRSLRPSTRHAPVRYAPEKHPATPRSWGTSRGRGRGPGVVESTPCCAITPRAVETEMWAAQTRLWTEWTGPRARWSSLVTRRRYPPSAGSITAPLGPVHSSPRHVPPRRMCMYIMLPKSYKL